MLLFSNSDYKVVFWSSQSSILWMLQVIRQSIKHFFCLWRTYFLFLPSSLPPSLFFFLSVSVHRSQTSFPIGTYRITPFLWTAIVYFVSLFLWLFQYIFNQCYSYWETFIITHSIVQLCKNNCWINSETKLSNCFSKMMPQWADASKVYENVCSLPTVSINSLF